MENKLVEDVKEEEDVGGGKKGEVQRRIEREARKGLKEERKKGRK